MKSINSLFFLFGLIVLTILNIYNVNVECQLFKLPPEINTNVWNEFTSRRRINPLSTIHLNPNNGQIKAVSGEMEPSNSDENSQESFTSSPLPPWRHHVNFDELHPGEDLIAEEQSRVSSPTVRPPPLPRQIKKPKEIEQMESKEESESRENTHERTMTRMMDNLLSLLSSNSDFEPWWKGANVCVKREEEDRTIEWTSKDESSSTHEKQIDHSKSNNPGFHLKFASCEDKETKHSCVTHLIGPNINKTIRTDYECCHGYLLNLHKKCERGTLKTITNTLAEVGGKEFRRLIQNVGLDTKLGTENLTIFVPSDDAIAIFMGSNPIDSNEISIALDQEIERQRRSILFPNALVSKTTTTGNKRRQTRQLIDSNNIDGIDWRRNALEQQNTWRSTSSSNKNGRGRQVTYSHPDNSYELQQTLLSHMSKGKITTDDFVDEKVIYSENNDNSVLRLNTWNVGTKKIKTVNCAKLISINHQCSNGMIHLVDRMFKKVTKNIAEIVTSHPDLTILKALLSISGHLNKFRDTKEHLTLFAPTNAALEKLGTTMLSKLRSGDPCLKRIVQNHILPFTLCSTIIYDKGQLRNSAHGILNIERTVDDKLFVNGTQIITKDIVTTNGVVHIIDAVLLSSNDKPISSALEKAGLTMFLQFMGQVGLRNYLDEINNVTIFAPSNQALQKLPREIRDNPTRLRDVLMYHIGGVETRACHFSNEQKMKSKFNDLSIRIDLHSMFPFLDTTEVTAQCGRLIKVNTPACNGIIHTVDRVLIPPQTDILQTLKTQSDFSILTRLIKETNLTDTLKAVGPYTIFAPTDTAFYSLPRERLENILNDKAEGFKILNQHIVAESLCCSGVSPNNWFITKRVKTLSDLLVPLYRDISGQVLFGNSRVMVCDLTASNGVIHTIDSLLDVDDDEDNEESMEFMGSCLPKIKDVHNTMFFGF